MKKVTSWAAIIAVPTAITGFYGQNVPYPGLRAPLGLLVLDRADRRAVGEPLLAPSAATTGSEDALAGAGRGRAAAARSPAPPPA